MKATDTEKRTKVITVGLWIIAGVSAAGVGIGTLMALGQDAAGAGMVTGLGVLGVVTRARTDHVHACVIGHCVARTCSAKFLNK